MGKYDREWRDYREMESKDDWVGYLIIILSAIAIGIMFSSMLPEAEAAEPVYGINLEGPEGLTRSEALIVMNGGNKEWNSAMHPQLRVVSYMSRFNKKFAAPVIRNFRAANPKENYLYRVRHLIRRLKLRKGRQILFAVFMPSLKGIEGQYFAGLAFKGTYMKKKVASIALTFGKGRNDEERNYLPMCRKIYQHEMGHVWSCPHSQIVEPGWDGKTTPMKECMMSPVFDWDDLPTWCDHEIAKVNAWYRMNKDFK